MTDEDLPVEGEGELPEAPPRPRRWWVAGLALLVAGALLAAFIPGLLPREKTGFGTGFVISPWGQVLTAAHVVEGATEITVHWDGRGYRAIPVALSAELDLALLLVEGAPPLPVAALAGERPGQGEALAAVGHPGGAIRASSLSTRVAGVGWSVVSDGTVLRDLIATTDPFRPGYSGAPLVNAAGQVVGIVLGRLNYGSASGPQFGYAVSIHRAADWLAGRGMALSFAPGEPSIPRGQAEVLELVVPSVVRIETRLPPGTR